MNAPGDTIYALATAPGRAALAVIRVSGPRAIDVVVDLTGTRPPPRQATLRMLRDTAGATLDQALILCFAGPASYTGEDVAEFQLHGGAAVIDSVLRTLATLPGLRAAEPGEFTRRAFERGKLDLTQVEAVADLVDAETAAQRRQALDQLGGALSLKHEAWRGLLLDALAWLEASVDFPDEDLPELLDARVAPILRSLEQALTAAVSDNRRGRRVREGYRIALIGQPNAGKSTLLNALAEREAAIVTATPGTTRDIIEVPLVWLGYAVILADTAGLRDTTDEIEAEGVRRATSWAADADLRLWIIDASQPGPNPLSELRADDFVVLNKRDLVPAGGFEPTLPGSVVRLSAQSATDVEQLRRLLQARVVADLSGSEFPSATRLRHAEALGTALACVQSAHTLLRSPELAADEVQRATRMLHRITGRVGVDDVLERVFASFCIGK